MLPRLPPPSIQDDYPRLEFMFSEFETGYVVYDQHFQGTNRDERLFSSVSYNQSVFSLPIQSK